MFLIITFTKTTIQFWQNLSQVKIMLVIHKLLAGLHFSWLVFLSILKTGLTSIYFKPVEREELGKKLLKLWYVNKVLISLSTLMIGTAISVAWDVFLELSLRTSSKVCSGGTKLKLNFGLLMFKILLFTKSVLWWSLYLLMEVFTQEFGVCSSIERLLGIDIFLTIKQKYLLKVLAINL